MSEWHLFVGDAVRAARFGPRMVWLRLRRGTEKGRAGEGAACVLRAAHRVASVRGEASDRRGGGGDAETPKGGRALRRLGEVALDLAFDMALCASLCASPYTSPYASL